MLPAILPSLSFVMNGHPHALQRIHGVVAATLCGLFVKRDCRPSHSSPRRGRPGTRKQFMDLIMDLTAAIHPALRKRMA
jgi:hypothetical protein